MKRKLYNAVSMLLLFLAGCDSNFLEKNPPDRISDAVFWQSEEDALLALTGLYSPTGGGNEDDFLSTTNLIFSEQKSDNAFETSGKDREAIVDGNLNPNNNLVADTWSTSYRRIGKVNYFLENIDRVEMDESRKTEMKAEARFLRAVYYFYMSQFWGSVPLIERVLTVEEANNITRTPREAVVDFALNELNEVAAALPETRPAAEKGRATKAAALAYTGRLLMSEERWAEAAAVYKSIIDMGIYQIDPQYRELFIEAGENSSEIIFSLRFVPDIGGKYSSDVHYRLAPYSIGGASQVNPLNSLVEAYECIDGKPINESPLYDPAQPFAKNGTPYRDPRLYYTILLPGYSTIRGIPYVTDPRSDSPDRMPQFSTTGYGWLKYLDEGFDGDRYSYGGDVPLIRYAEILLSYLESKLEAGDPITQTLLDETINQVRGRAAVNMPPVTETAPDALRTILRRERRVELALEGIRYWDILRWKIAHLVLNGNLYGAKVCDDPQACDYEVDEQGYYRVYTRHFRENVDYQWPVPQSELDVNPALGQNPGY